MDTGRTRPARRAFGAACALGVLAASAGFADDRAPSRAPSAPLPQESAPTPEREVGMPVALDGPRAEAIERGLAWLATRQDERDGSILVDDADKGQRAPLAVTSLAALAWVSGGSTPTRGPHQDHVTRAIEYLLACVHRTADEYPGYIQDREDAISRTHGHGLATLALAQAYTVSPRSPLGERIGEALVSAVRRIEVSQGTEGGWEYEPYRTLDHEGSVTVALVQALRAAQDAGVQVDPDVIAKAVDYVKRLQVLGADEVGKGRLGGFRYGLSDPRDSLPLTAAALSTLQAAGVYEGESIDEGYAYVWRKARLREDEPGEHESAFPYYERFYLSQALWHHRDPRLYTRWAEGVATDLIARQEAAGSWDDVRYAKGGVRVLNRYGSAYATAFNVLFLALPDGFLPAFQR